MPQISIRLEQELYDRIESLRGEKERTSFIKELIVSQLDLQSNANDSHRNANGIWDTNVIHLNEEIEYLRKKLDESTVMHNQEKLELLRLLNQSQILQMQAQKQLTEAQEIKNKTLKWWQFWKK